MFCFKRSFQRDWWGSSEESLDLGARLAKCFLSKGAESGGEERKKRMQMVGYIKEEEKEQVRKNKDINTHGYTQVIFLKREKNKKESNVVSSTTKRRVKKKKGERGNE